MLLWFTGATVTLFGKQIKTLEAGHAVLMQAALDQFTGTFPSGTDTDLMLLGNRRADMPGLRPDATISLWHLALALVRAQTLPKYAHAMRQPWHHPTRHLWRVQQALYDRLLLAVTTADAALASERFGAALHTLQDTYTPGHADRENNADVFSPLVRLHYSPSQAHPLISPYDRVWADDAKTTLTAPAQAAVSATVAAFDLWCDWWHSPPAKAHPVIELFVQQYVPVREAPFSARRRVLYNAR